MEVIQRILRGSGKRRPRAVTDVRIILCNGVINVSQELKLSFEKVVGRLPNAGEKDFVFTEENFRDTGEKSLAYTEVSMMSQGAFLSPEDRGHQHGRYS
jgi:hypothetical protein